MLAAALPAMAQQQSPALVLVEDGQAEARIVVGENVTPTGQFAAEELQQAIELISGAKLPITTPGSGEDAAARIVLGTPEANELVEAQADRFADDLAFLEDTDGFAVRRDGETLYIFAAMPKGVLNGIYDVLEDNTSLLWFRAGPEGVAYEKTDQLAIEKTDYRERPAFHQRGWHLLGIWRHVHKPTSMWMIRNRCNYEPVHMSILGGILEEDLPLLQRRFQVAGGSGHNILRKWMPHKRYFEEHPEYYAMIGGVRRLMGGHAQLCYSNEQMTDAFIERVLSEIADLPSAIDAIGIFQQDSQHLCQGPLCTKPIHLPDGTVVDPGDEAFRSTQYFLFLNQVARAVKEHHPKMDVITYAYQFTAEPPKVAVPDNVIVRLCPIPASAKHTLHEPVNALWLRRTQEWASKARVIWREYYGCIGTVSHFPRPLAQTVQADLQYINSLGVRRVVAGVQPDAEKDASVADRPMSHAWDASSMQFWLITRLWWNPDADLDKLRQRYLNRVYKQASPAMAEFYALIHEAWYSSPRAEYYNASVRGLAQRYIKEAGIEDECRAALEEAATLAQKDRVAQRVKTMQARFEGWTEQIAAADTRFTPTMAVPATDADVTGVLDFTDSAWNNATVIDGLAIMGKPDTPSSARTVVRLLHDQRNLYIGVRSFDEDGNISAPTHEGFEKFPDGDRIEIFFDGGHEGQALYYQLAFNAAGWQYDGKGFDKSWNGDWSVQTRIGDTGWRAVAVVPWETIGVKPISGKQLDFLIYRFIAPGGQETSMEHSSWGGGSVHSPASFGTLALEGP